MYVLEANIFGRLVPVKSVIEYGEHEAMTNSDDNQDWQRIRYAVVMLEFGNIVVNVDLSDLFCTYTTE